MREAFNLEYADGISNGIPSKVAGVANINNTFATGKVNPDGSFFTHAVELNIPKGYFTLSLGRTNGTAANQTARALNVANIRTQVWYLQNPKASNTALDQKWNKNIDLAMRIIGGGFSQNSSFALRSLAPYIEEFFLGRTYQL
ncbi:hypothetical protein FEE95_06875 [Maribacter algarum]|uniref:Uncharacterized protein n=1 Tax=Maribacter algarum (ex Zhang et al. 2020) TaxID=2578118 RepID=A0A5S3PVX1_9FLAO|nr:hypothetical protein [Maribacter algarum]TMM59149.1 hypothetical protein FEE95_06875 [Maribacter algarum]